MRKDVGRNRYFTPEQAIECAPLSCCTLWCYGRMLMLLVLLASAFAGLPWQGSGFGII